MSIKPLPVPELRLEQRDAFWVGEFRAMASPCEVHIEHASEQFATALITMAMQEALRIESAFSRYRTDNELHAINTSRGHAITVSDEMGRLLDFSQTCFDNSGGLFDISSGVLREVWQFDGSSNVPLQSDVDHVLTRIGWQKVSWQSPSLVLPQGMQIDLGGIGKEYAVDRCTSMLKSAAPDVACLVNYGGDINTSCTPRSKSFWQVGISGVASSESESEHSGERLSLQLVSGALTTSGDAQRYLLHDGVRYGHILNPLTGWPEPDAPSSVTVAGDSCIQAGVLSTLAILKGAHAESFLREQDVQFWCQR